MKKMMSADRGRRKFIKTAGLGVLCGGVLSTNPVSKTIEKPMRQINPMIDNLRVVSCYDPDMVSGNPSGWNMEEQNKPVKSEKVDRNMDAMAKALSQKSEPQDSWGVIFQKPPSKKWTEVRVAIKVNCISKNHPRVAIVSKVCRELIALGIKAENIILYDSDDNAFPFYSPYIGKGLPTGIVVSEQAQALGGMVGTTIPLPFPGTFQCTADIAKGAIDILVNIAVNKGHSKNFGGTTLTSKNHAGTFEPGPLHKKGKMDYLIAINKSEAILGGNPCRQQLCIVDSLWAMKKGPFGVPNKRTDRIIMGTCGPVVDYVTAKRIREPLLGAIHPNIDRFMDDFGYGDNKSITFIPVESVKG